jgi:spermidine/putrescine transport system permease protein
MKRVLIGCAVAAVYLFFYVPIAVLVAFSFNSVPFPSPWVSFTFAWYHELFTTPYVWYAFLNSCVIAFCATVMSIVLSLALVYLRMFKRKSSKLQSLFSLFYGNLIVPEVVLGVGLLTFFVICSVPLGMLTLIVAHTVLGLGFAVPLLHGRFDELDVRLVEASLDLGATVHQTFFSIIVPLLRSTTVAAALLIFIISMLRTGISPIMNALSTLLLILSSVLVLLFCWTSFSDRSEAQV